MSLFDNMSGSKQVKSIIDVLDNYKETLIRYQAKVEKQTKEDQMAAVQSALDLTYIKEELDLLKPSQDLIEKDMQSIKIMLEEKTKYIEDALKKSSQMLNESQKREVLTAAEILDKLDKLREEQGLIGEKISGIDTAIIEPIKSNYTANRNAVNEKLDEMMEVILKGTGKTKTALIISIVFNIITVGGLILSILLGFGLF